MANEGVLHDGLATNGHFGEKTLLEDLWMSGGALEGLEMTKEFSGFLNINVFTGHLVSKVVGLPCAYLPWVSAWIAWTRKRDRTS